MIILGLTGGVGMGKSTVAQMLRGLGIPVFDADRCVHRALTQKNGRARAQIIKMFPGAYDRTTKTIQRRKLGDLTFGRPTNMKRLEAILHPHVRAAERRFIARHRRLDTGLIVLDIPLLYETGADQLCDAAICVTAPARLQRARVLSRPGMTAEKFAKIRAAQMPERQKQARTDFVLDTGQDPAGTRRDLQAILRAVKRTYA